MSFWEHARFQVFSPLVHPLNNTIGDQGYANDAMPGGGGSFTSALDYIFAVLYPNAKDAVANQASLPLVGNTLNDYRVVSDDGDGKSAGYRWEQREGEASPSWHKIYDFDWSTDSILSSYLNITQELYVFKKGMSDIDASGNVVTGLYAGQTIFGGNQANQNLTLKANSGDGVGSPTGFVQVDDNFRPAQHNTFDLGTNALRFKDGYFQGTCIFGNLNLGSGSITDSSGSISFGDENLSTTGTIGAASVTATSFLKVDQGADEVTLTPASLLTTLASFSFGSANLSTTGTLGTSTHTITESGETLILDANNGAGKATILSSLGVLNFGASNLETSGNINVGTVTGTYLTIDNINIDGNAITSAVGTLQLNAVTSINLLKPLISLGITATGTVGVTGQLDVDNLRLDGNTISTTDTNGSLSLLPDGTGLINLGSTILPTTNGTKDLGSTSLRWQNLFLSGSLGDGTNTISTSTLMSLRSSQFRDLAQTVPAVAGDTLFWDAVNQVWLASHPDSEVTHNELSGLTAGDAGHTQFAMLAGRAGGQTLQGGTGNAQDLVLESTSGATKGAVKTKDNFVPFTNASYNISVWDGTDLGSPSLNFRDLYMKGEAKGLRLENYTTGTLPASSMQNIGRIVWATDNNKPYIDTGTALTPIGGANKFQSDTSWNGSDTTKDVNVSANITDARTAIWQLRDNANNFEIMYVKIETISATTVRITTNVALPVGSYRLIGIE